jgi:protein-S-isoprenylcysteine O-methyltransferase Ste14
LNWKNVPIPAGHLVPLILGIILQRFSPLHLLNSQWVSYILGVPLLITGILLAGWSVYEVRDIDIDRSDRLITTGPYALSRNPMYVAWSLIYLASVFLVNSIWLLVTFPLLLLYTHFFVILNEEKQLAVILGEQYLEYKSKVKRYF